jgi:serine/threonine-protein kinase
MSAPTYSDRYEILRHLARGGMAEVYLARDHLLDRPVAVKVLSSEFARDPTFVERFRREARAAANLSHPGIVSVYDWGEAAGTYYIVMEYVEGRSLRDIIQHSAPLHPHRAAEICGDIADALAFAHDKGVVHRDVKPGNVLITPQGQVKVTDFGIARAGVADNLTQTGAVMGTAVYFSPEQAQGLATDGRSDIYSLGVVLYEMVTSYPPFGGDSPVAIAYKHVREPVVPPTLLNPDVAPDLEAIALTCLAKNPNDRYQTARDLRADLLRFRQGQRIQMAPVTALPEDALAAPPLPVPAPVPQPPEHYRVQPREIVVRPPDPTVAVRRAAVVTGRGPGAQTVGTRIVAPPPRGRFLRGLAFALLFITLVAGITALVVFISRQVDDNSGASSEDVEVINVRGMKADDAEALLRDKGLLTTRQLQLNSQVPAGQVFDQDPADGAVVAKGTVVKLIISQPVTQVNVPQGIKGQQYDTASAQLSKDPYSFKVVRQDQPTAGQVPGTVVDTQPIEGSPLNPGDQITLIVATQPTTLTVPDLTGKNGLVAAAELQKAGFGSLQISQQREASDTVAAGLATRTEPVSGTQVPFGSAVTVWFSTGPEQLPVPNVVGRSLADATSTLQADKGAFTTGVVTNTTSCTAADNGKVVSQDPGANGTAKPGSPVNLAVCQRTDTPTTGATPTTVATATTAPTATTSTPST